MRSRQRGRRKHPPPQRRVEHDLSTARLLGGKAPCGLRRTFPDHAALSASVNAASREHPEKLPGRPKKRRRRGTVPRSQVPRSRGSVVQGNVR